MDFGNADLAVSQASCQENEAGGDAPQTRPQATLQLAREPTFLVGVQEGPAEYVLHNIDGAASLADGSVAVGVRGSHQVRKYDSQGRHLWSQGRYGEGPGEYQGVMLLHGCTSDESIATYDIYNRRVTKLDGQGSLIADYPLQFENGRPHVLACSPSGRFVFSAWGTRQAEDPGPHRWEVPVAFTDSAESDIVLLRDNVPGQDRVQYFEDDQRTLNGPRVWGRRIVLGATDSGAWLGTGDDYELEFLNWDGTTVRRLRWKGPDLAVTRRRSVDGHSVDAGSNGRPRRQHRLGAGAGDGRRRGAADRQVRAGRFVLT